MDNRRHRDCCGGGEWRTPRTFGLPKIGQGSCSGFATVQFRRLAKAAKTSFARRKAKWQGCRANVRPPPKCPMITLLIMNTLLIRAADAYPEGGLSGECSTTMCRGIEAGRARCRARLMQPYDHPSAAAATRDRLSTSLGRPKFSLSVSPPRGRWRLTVGTRRSSPSSWHRRSLQSAGCQSRRA